MALWKWNSRLAKLVMSVTSYVSGTWGSGSYSCLGLSFVVGVEIHGYHSASY